MVKLRRGRRLNFHTLHVVEQSNVSRVLSGLCGGLRWGVLEIVVYQLANPIQHYRKATLQIHGPDITMKEKERLLRSFISKGKQMKKKSLQL